MKSSLDVVTSIVRAWTWLYTWHMGETPRTRRRTEIECDLWEFQQDRSCHTRLQTSAHVLWRLIAGIPDDLRWRMEQDAVDIRLERTITMTARTTGAAIFVVLVCLINADVGRTRPAYAFAAPTVVIDHAKLPPLAAGIATTVSASLLHRDPLRAGGQSPGATAALNFEVASIKPNKSGSPRSSIAPQPGGRFTATNVSLATLIRNAYQFPAFRMTGGPDWVESDRFDVTAKADGDAPQEQIRLMLRQLLADRFRLQVHTEQREQPIYELVLARRDGRLGPQLRRSAVDCAGVPPDLPDTFPARGAPRCGFIGPSPAIAISSGRSTAAFRGLTLEAFARFLSPALRRSVVDKTGLTGYFDGDFDPTVEIGPPPPPPGIPDPYDRPNFPTIFTVVQEQLGLKLNSARGPVDVLVIDRAEPPTPD